MTVAGYMGANDVPPRRCRCFLLHHHHQQCSKRRDDTEMKATLLCGKIRNVHKQNERRSRNMDFFRTRRRDIGYLKVSQSVE